MAMYVNHNLGQHRCRRCKYPTSNLSRLCGACVNLVELAKPNPKLHEVMEEREQALERVKQSLAA